MKSPAHGARANLLSPKGTHQAPVERLQSSNILFDYFLPKSIKIVKRFEWFVIPSAVTRTGSVQCVFARAWINLQENEDMNPVGIFGWDIVLGAKYLALASLIKTVLYSVLEAARMLYAWHWVHAHPIIPINARLVKVVKPTGFDNLVIGERLHILGRYYFNPTCILISLGLAVLVEIVWFLGVIQGHWNICVGWFAVMATGIVIAIIEDQAPPSLSEVFIMYQMWVMFGYLTHWPHQSGVEAA